MIHTIRIKWITHARVNIIKLQLELEKKRPVTYDEVIAYLVEKELNERNIGTIHPLIENKSG